MPTLPPVTELDIYLKSLSIPIHGVDVAGGSYVVNYMDSATVQQRSTGDAIAAGWDENEEAGPTKLLRRRAKSLLDDEDTIAVLMRAFGLAALDEVNVTRQWLASFKAEVAAATNLADLKARVAGLPATPDRTKSQLMNAIRGKIDTGNADDS